MKSISSVHTDYREQIRQNFHDRVQRNPSYSLRAYARDLGIAYSRLHDTIHGKKGISAPSAKKIAVKLNFSAAERDLFLTKVEAEHSRSPLARKKAVEKLENLRALHGNQNIQEDIFRLIKDWHHFAIVELTTIEGYVDSPEWIAKRLGIGLVEAQSAIKRLLELKVLENKDGRLKPSEEFTFTDSSIPSDAIKKNHEQILNKARQALYFQSLEERDFNSLTFAVDTADVNHAKSFIKDFLMEFDRKFGKSGNKKAVYSLSTQLIRLDSEDKNEQ